MYPCAVQALEELPLEVAHQCSGSAGALRGACANVEAGQLADHPKLAALRRALTAFRTLKAVRLAFLCLQGASPHSVLGYCAVRAMLASQHLH